MQTKKNTKANIFLVLALVVIIGSRFMPDMAWLSSDACAVLGLFFGSLTEYDHASGFRFDSDFRIFRNFCRGIRKYDSCLSFIYLYAGISAF